MLVGGTMMIGAGGATPVFAAAGQNCDPGTSPDGAVWTTYAGTPLASVKIGCIAWNGTTWVAMRSGGAYGNCYTSPDGVTWTSQNIPISFNCYGICWNGSIFVAVGGGDGTQCVTSPDGVTWTAHDMPQANWYGVAWNGSVFAACCDNPANGKYIATSPDGITWTSRSTTMNAATDIAWNGTVFCIVYPNSSYSATSTDGISWTRHDTAFPGNDGPKTLCWNGTIFCGAEQSAKPADGTRRAHTSPDGATWTTRTMPDGYIGQQIYDIAWNGSVFCQGSSANGGHGAATTSPDGTTWTDHVGVFNGNTIFALGTQELIFGTY